MPLTDLPKEIVLDIADHLHYQGVNTLCRTNSRLYRLLNIYLYRRDVTQSEGSSLLWAAKRADGELIRESTSTAQWALDASRHFDQIPEFYHLALKIAARYGHARLVELLLKIDDINPNFAEKHLAFAEGFADDHWDFAEGYENHRSFAKHLWGFEKDHLGTPPLTLAVKSGHNAIVEMLLATADIDPNIGDYYNRLPLHHACMRRHVSIVKQLLARDDVDVNALGFSLSETPLLIACDNEWRISDKPGEEIANLLLNKAGIDVNSTDTEGDTPLMLAAQYGKMSVLKSLLARNDLDPNMLNPHFGYHVLGCMAYEGHIATVKLLLGHPHTDLNLVTEPHGHSALMSACRGGNPGMVKFLLSREGIMINQQDTDGLTALCHVTEFGYSRAYMNGGHVRAAKLLDLLLQKDGINPNSRDNNGRTPLARVCLRPIGDTCYYAVTECQIRRCVTIVRSLLSHRDVDPNAVDNNNVSILADVINKVIPHRTFWYEYGDYGREIESLLRAAGAS